MQSEFEATGLKREITNRLCNEEPRVNKVNELTA